ncbi:TolC family protein [Paraburkholderia sp. D15]|uniref:TolC family protein n=1 Tax=Paraburkholderia sp. D15 TaxID=2880218 RepID=UPI00247A3B41|nr:TolC family protein [Paraburkholderia sp. D15]WGS54063.1 TolC family protein [Paraburkholderia sp. D15]
MTRTAFQLAPARGLTNATAWLAILLILGGCTTFSKDGGFDTVSTTASERLGKSAVRVITPEDHRAVIARTDELLSKPLAMDDAVQIALLNNRGLQAAYAELGIAEADLVQAGRLPNPGFSFSRTQGGNDLSISRTFTLGLAGVLTMPLATRIESRRFEQTRLLAADAMLNVAADARRAYVVAVAAQQSASYAGQVSDAAQAAAELASRMRQAGHYSKLDQAREQAFYADAMAQRARARQQAASAREKLTRAMGLWGTQTQYALPGRLPDLPTTRPDLPDLERFAMRNRLDIQAARLRTQSVASSLGLSKATRFINALDVGYQNNFTTSDGREQGYEISVEIPVFDWGDAKVARAQALYRQSVDRLAATAIDARSEVRDAYSAYVSDYDLAKHYRDEVVPLRKTISDELLLRYNGMLASVFDLLADSREQIGAVNGAIDALKDYWLADTDLRRSLGGRLPIDAAAQQPQPQPMATTTQAIPPNESAQAAEPSEPLESKGQ